jgi:hypothetical protein
MVEDATGLPRGVFTLERYTRFYKVQNWMPRPWAVEAHVRS